MAVATEDTIQAGMGKAIIIHKELFAQLATGSNNLQARPRSPRSNSRRS